MTGNNPTGFAPTGAMWATEVYENEAIELVGFPELVATRTSETEVTIKSRTPIPADFKVKLSRAAGVTGRFSVLKTETAPLTDTVDENTDYQYIGQLYRDSDGFEGMYGEPAITKSKFNLL